MRSLAILGGLCSFFAFASSVISAPPLPLLTEQEILSAWIDYGDVWGMDECFPTNQPRTVREIFECTDDGFSGEWFDVGYQDLVGNVRRDDGFVWLSGFPMVTPDPPSFVQTFPTFSDFLSLRPLDADRIFAVLGTFNSGLLFPGSQTENPPFLRWTSETVSNMLSAVRFRWEHCPVVTEFYVGVNYCPRWWADGNHIGCITSSQYFLYTGSSQPRPPYIYVADSDLFNVFTNSIHVKWGELWE